MQERRPVSYPLSRVPLMYPSIFWDDCEGTFNYVVTADGADYVAAYATAAAYVGTKGMHLKTRITNPANGDLVTIYKKLPLPPTGLVRLRIHHMNPDTTPTYFWYLYLYYFDGTNYYAPELCFDASDEKVYYAATVRANYTDTTLIWNKLQYTWNVVDWSIDLSAHTFHTLRVNDSIVDMSTISLPSAANASVPRLQFYIEIATVGAVITPAYFDQILITAENP